MLLGEPDPNRPAAPIGFRVSPRVLQPFSFTATPWKEKVHPGEFERLELARGPSPGFENLFAGAGS